MRSNQKKRKRKKVNLVLDAKKKEGTILVDCALSIALQTEEEAIEAMNRLTKLLQRVLLFLCGLNRLISRTNGSISVRR